MATTDTARFKIDVCHDNWWNYGVYERQSFFGFKFWSCLKKTDDLSVAKDFVTEVLKLPIFISKEEDLV